VRQPFRLALNKAEALRYMHARRFLKESIIKQTYYFENLPSPLFAKEG
jgi:hypothetical protein